MIEGITGDDVYVISKIYKKAEDAIVEQIQGVDFLSSTAKASALGQIRSILKNLYQPTEKFILKQSEIEYQGGIDEVDSALKKVGLGGGFNVIDPKATEFVLSNLSTIQNVALDDVKKALSTSYINIKKSLDLTEKATQEIIEAIAKGQVLGDSRQKTKQSIIQILKEKGIVTPEIEKNIKQKQSLKSQNTKTRNEIRKLRSELKNVDSKKLAEDIKKQIKEKRVIAEQLKKQIKEIGITGFSYQDKNGVTKNLHLNHYVEGLTRSTLINSRASAVIQRSSERGSDLLKISTHSNSSPMCRPWAGKIVSISGNNTDYPALDQALFNGDYKRGGIFHRYCRHSLTVYIPTDIQFKD